jgi:hypothetical protein
MIISDLNYLEVVFETTSIVGGACNTQLVSLADLANKLPPGITFEIQGLEDIKGVLASCSSQNGDATVNTYTFTSS